MSNNVNKALRLFSRCVEDLLKRDDIDVIYLPQINRYVFANLMLEDVKAKLGKGSAIEADYKMVKKMVEEESEMYGFDTFETLDKPKPTDDTSFPALKIVRD